MYLTGIVEAIGAVALLIPPVSVLDGVFLATEIVVGVGVHWTNAEFIPDSIPAIVLVLLLPSIAYSRRDTITWALAQNKGRA